MVPNQFPINESRHRIALVGEAPGYEETKEGKPFIGASGRFLNVLLSRAGTSRESCFVGNVCQEQPSHNEIASFDWMGAEIQAGIEQLKKDLEIYQPNIIVALGGAALHLLKAGNVPPRKVKNKGRLTFKWPYSPSTWRGSLFASTLNGCKAMGTLHPAYVLRDYEAAPLLQFDLKKAVRESTTPKLNLPQRNFCIDQEKVLENLAKVKEAKQPVAIDIEGGINTMSCISFATSPNYAFIVPFFYQNGERCYDLKTECKVWRALAEVLEDVEIPKVLQNSLYDRFILQYCYRIRVRNVIDDTMVKHHEKYCEIPKSLATQASIYTDEPYWKYMRKEDTAGK